MNLSTTYSEQELVSAFRLRDEKAFAYLYDHYSGALYSVVNTVLADTELANDVLQQVFINIWRRFDSYDASKGRLFTWMMNIARNAAQAIRRQPDGSVSAQGQITLRTRAARQVTLFKRRHRLALEVQVLDDGPGIPDDIRERMFYPLVSGRAGGSGLGLTLAQSFVQQHQGTIDCESRPGHTCFTIRLPLA